MRDLPFCALHCLCDRTPIQQTPCYASYQTSLLFDESLTRIFTYSIGHHVRPLPSFSFSFLSSSTILRTHSPPVHSITMSGNRAQSRQKNITVAVHRKKSTANPQASISQHISCNVGSTHTFKSRTSIRPSSALLSASTSASPAPSSATACSHVPELQTVQWDLPTTHGSQTNSSHTPRKKAQVCSPLHLFSIYLSSLSLFLQEKPMNSWIPLVPSFLDEIIYCDGPGSCSTDGSCYSCGQISEIFRCNECMSSHLLCQVCILKIHVNSPLHRIEVSFLCFPINLFFLLISPPYSLALEWPLLQKDFSSSSWTAHSTRP